MGTDIGLKRGGGVAVWRQIAEELRAEIRAGHYRAGDKIANELELAPRFGVNRHTVRRAIAELVEEGLLEARRGRGTFVTTAPIDYPIGARTRFSEIVSAQARVPGGRLLNALNEPADGLTSQKLAVAAGTGLLRLETLSVADDLPLSTATSWFVAEMVPRLLEVYRETGSITRGLEAHGLGDYRRVETRLTAQLAEPGDALRLKIAAGGPVLVSEAVNVDPDGRPIQFSRSRFAGERVQVVVRS